MRVSDELRIRITDMNAEGEGTALVDGRRVHVAGAVPGDLVRTRVTSLARQSDAAFARLESILEPAPGRRRAPCENDATNRGRCSGCPLAVLDEDAQRVAKARVVAAALGRDVDRFVQGAALGYRASSKRVVAGEASALVLGSYARGSHRVADMRSCLVDHPLIRDAADAVASIGSALGVVPFDESTGEGTLRYVWLKTNGEDVLVTLVGRVHDQPDIAELAARLPVRGVALAENVARGNVVRGERVTLVSGEGALATSRLGVDAEIGPLGFLQPNLEVAASAYASLVRDAAGAPLTGALALDLYAGLGVTTAVLRRTFGRVVPCESHAESAAALGVAPSTAQAFLEAIVAEPAHPLRGADAIVANPPRGGMGEHVVRALVALAPPQLAIMSCSPASLARDLASLVAPVGPYALVALEAYDTLPQTAHVEVVAKLVRAPS